MRCTGGSNSSAAVKYQLLTEQAMKVYPMKVYSTTSFEPLQRKATHLRSHFTRVGNTIPWHAPVWFANSAEPNSTLSIQVRLCGMLHWQPPMLHHLLHTTLLESHRYERHDVRLLRFVTFHICKVMNMCANSTWSHHYTICRWHDMHFRERTLGGVCPLYSVLL